LILWGEEDALLPRDEQEWRAAEIPNAIFEHTRKPDISRTGRGRHGL
jgi:pimeloyl-ACP methyl ester carboxylesterase